MKTRKAFYLGAALAAFALAILVVSSPAWAGGSERQECELSTDAVTDGLRGIQGVFRVESEADDKDRARIRMEINIEDNPPTIAPFDTVGSNAVALQPEVTMGTVQRVPENTPVISCTFEADNVTGDLVCDNDMRGTTSDIDIGNFAGHHFAIEIVNPAPGAANFIVGGTGPCALGD